MVREDTDGLWTLPGGFAEVGTSPSENVVREIWEEASLRVKANALYGIRHKAKHEYDPDARDFYKLFFLCEKTHDSLPKPGRETTEVGFFPFGKLPPLSTGRILPKDIAAAFAFKKGPQRLSFFD